MENVTTYQIQSNQPLSLLERFRELRPTEPGGFPQVSLTGVESEEFPALCQTHRENPQDETYLRESRWCERCEANRKREIVRQHLGDMHIAKRFQGKEWADYVPVCNDAAHHRELLKRYADNFDRALERGSCGVLMGRPGTGKSTLAALVCTTLAANGHTALHTTVARLVRRVRETWRAGAGESETQVFQQLLEPDLLVVDEVGVQQGSLNERNILTEIINDRYAEMRPTLLITNLDIETLETALGERIVDRFHDPGSFLLTFDWPSYRRRACNGGQ